MNTVTQITRRRQAIVLWAQKKGVTSAARRYNVSRQLVYRWMKRYDGTLESLQDHSHRPKSHPNQHTEDEIKLIKDMQKRNKHTGLMVFWVKLRQRGYRAFFYLIAYSGFRRSEMLGLEWKDIDFENNFISIKRTSNYTSERGIYTNTTKTKRSKRVLKISSYIMGIIKELKDEQDEEALRLSDKRVERDRLFVKWNGEEMNNQTPYGWLKEFCEKNDLPFYGLHSFRHFAASTLISVGLDVVTVSGR